LKTYKQKKIQIKAICPKCKKNAIISVTASEIKQTKENNSLIQKATLHEDHVVIVYVDGQCRIRRTYAYTTDNYSKDLRSKSNESTKPKNIPDLDTLFDEMLKKSLCNEHNDI